MDKTLEQLFESRPKIRTLRLFLMNPTAEYGVAEGMEHTGVPRRQLTAELKKLLRIGLVNTKISRETIILPRKPKHGKARKPKIKAVRKRVYFVNQEFPLYQELRDLVFKISPDGYGDLLLRMRRLGNIRLAIISGVFTDTENARADLLLVGDKLKKARVAAFFKSLQAEVGKELNYAVMTTNEFNERRDMQDRFIRDILDVAHEKLINKLGV